MALADNLRACFNLDEASGNRLSSVNGYALVPYNGVGSVVGKIGNAASFVNASSTMLNNDSGSALDTAFTSAYTIAIWIYPTSTAQGTLIAKGASAAAGQYEFYVLKAASGAILTAFGAGGGGVITSTDLVALNTWSFVLIWHDATTFNLQINNGTVQSQTVGFGNFGSSANTALGAIGTPSINSSRLDGYLDAAMIWDRALTSAERTQTWNVGNGLTCALLPDIIATTAFTDLTDTIADTAVKRSQSVALANTEGSTTLCKDSNIGALPAQVQCTGSNIIDWPWPRIFPTKYRVLGCSKQVSGNLILSELRISSGRYVFKPVQNLGSAAAINQIDVADFGPFYVVSTLGVDATSIRQVQTFIRDTTKAAIYQCLVPWTIPAMGTVCNFNGQLIGGNISACIPVGNPWEAFAPDTIVWSAIGNFEFNPLVDRTAGYYELLFPESGGKRATIYKVLPMGSTINVYSDAGKISLVPAQVGETFTYSPRMLSGLGIASGNHVAGDDYVQGFIDLNNDFWFFEHPNFNSDVGRSLTKVGFRLQISDMIAFVPPSGDSRLIVSYLPRDKRFYISNGNECLIINEFGGCKVFQSINSILIGHDKILYGAFKQSTDTEARIFTDSMDFGVRGLKSVEAILAGVSHSSGEKSSAAVDWRINKSSPFTRSVWKSSGPTGEVGIHVTAEEFRLGVKVSNYLGAEIETLNAAIKFSDHRFRRGPITAIGTALRQEE